MSAQDLRANYDPITLEVIRMRLDNIVEEMGIAMIRSSGSPVITEARDYNTALFDHQGRFFSYSDAVQLHIGSGGVAVRNLLDAVGPEEMNPGDAFISNDPHTAGSSHPPDTTVISPIFVDETLVGFAQSQAHLIDVGGMTPGGFAPAAFDCFAEALRIPPGVKIFDRGVVVESVRRLIATNVRVPVLHWNDVRSMVASNNTGIRRLLSTVEEFGLDTFRDYTALSFRLAEEVLRGRIADIPDGVYASEDWVEGNGHDDRLHRVACTMTVAGDSITFDFAGSSRQTDGFINCSYGALVGSVATAAVAILGWDVPFNEGVMRAFRILAPEASIVNPTVPAPVSNGHLTTGVRATRLVTRLLSQACVRSQNEIVQRRVQGEWGDSWTGGITSGVRTDTDEFFVWFNMDGGGTGTGAQVVRDGLDAGGAMGAVGNLLPDVEMNELLYPTLYLWKQLAVDSCGPGASRGGMGIDLAWTLWGAEESVETVFSPTAAVPAWGFAGGYPGGGSGFEFLRDTNLRQLLHDGRYPTRAALEAHSVELQDVNAQDLRLRSGDVFRCWIAGGGGIGDPLLRDPALVAADLWDGYVTEHQARWTYGVEPTDAPPGWDPERTSELREAIRQKRRSGQGGTASGVVATMRPVDATVQTPVPTRNSAGEWKCPGCGGSLGAEEEWSLETVRTSPLSPRLGEVGVRVRPCDDAGHQVLLEEQCCSACATLLSVRVRVVSP